MKNLATLFGNLKKKYLAMPESKPSFLALFQNVRN
jgi:hypothetical protein